jgi:Glycosyltransferase family 87
VCDEGLGTPGHAEVAVGAREPEDQHVGERARRWSRHPENGRRLVECGFCGIILAWLLVKVVREDAFATDFRYAFWPAGRHVLSGTSPFPHVIDFDRLPFVYPAPAAVVFAPFAVLPRPAAEAVFTLLLGAAVVLALRLCRVRDPRCYVLAFLWAPVFSALQTANLTLVLAVGLAAVWRLERRPLAAAAVAACLVALKVFLWPIVVWLVVRRGLRSGVESVLIAVAVLAASWWTIGFAGLRDYPHLMSLISRVEGPRSYSLAALGMRLDLGHALATALALALGLAVLAAAALLARRDADGRRSFALIVVAILLCTPVIWLHYFALLLVAVAVLRPRLSAVWFFPLLLWPCPVMLHGPTFWPLAPLLVFLAGAATERLGVPWGLAAIARPLRLRLAARP